MRTDPEFKPLTNAEVSALSRMYRNTLATRAALAEAAGLDSSHRATLEEFDATLKQAKSGLRKVRELKGQGL
jgi:hypothetical protein